MNEEELVDYFAGMALQGILAGRESAGDLYPLSTAKESYMLADAMIKRRAKRKEELLR